jgi:hypothetical protein
MAKSKKAIGGPFVTAALLCNSVTEDSDGVVSALRIVDEIRAVIPHNAPIDFPSETTPVEVSLFALVIIRRGDARGGKHVLRLVVETPTGKTSELTRQTVEMPKYPNGAAAVKARMTLKLRSAGVFWIDVFLGKDRLTRMALNLLIQRAQEPI